MKTLIIYFSFSGNNEFLAKELQRIVGGDIEKIVELKRRTGLTILFDVLFNRKPKIERLHAPLAKYDKFILVAPVWNGRIATPMKSFITMEKENLKEYSFITVCTGGHGQLAKITAEVNGLALTRATVVAELKINDLLPSEQKGKIRYATPYRIHQKDLPVFVNEIKRFLDTAKLK